ncbi:ATP-binding protein [Planctomonas psychrotolerans]|uniref:ATP-binding protein n=1 Tax=Planctomonas psychrotolerans TaxID=2528712 RepID=UPI0012387E3E|nr:ATP-binding protein [Planctomonas psychrotolerans]
MTDVLAEVSRSGPATAETVDALHDDLDRLWAAADFVPDLDRMAFATAVIEAASNVVQHAVPSRESVQLGVDISVRPHRLHARILEIGAAPASVELAGEHGDDEEAESGRGLALIRALVSTVTFERRGADNVWVLWRDAPGATS